MDRSGLRYHEDGCLLLLSRRLRARLIDILRDNHIDNHVT